MSISSFSRNAELTDQTRNLLRKPSFDNWYENILKLEISNLTLFLSAIHIPFLILSLIVKLKPWKFFLDNRH